jgi:AAA+ superfamily predicted ATPase
MKSLKFLLKTVEKTRFFKVSGFLCATLYSQFLDLAVLSRFASMEYKFGDIERGKTMFEKILETYPKKIHIWTLYIDMVVKFENLDEARYDS